MKIFTNKDIKLFFNMIAVVLATFILLGQIMAAVIANDYKSQMIMHDYEIAGYLYNNKIEPSEIPLAFITVKTGQDFSTGQSMLQSVGYKTDTDNQLIPIVKDFHQKYALIFLLYSLILSTFIFTVLFFYFFRQEKALENANISIRAFMDGNTNTRIDSTNEGSLSILFHSINGMATSLNAHLTAEKQTKEFLKNTISDISHQLKTPLAALKMYNEILDEESANETIVKKFVGKSENALVRMEILIQNLLKITKLDAGTITLSKKSENIKEFIQKVTYSFETRAEKEDKIISIDGSDTDTLYCDVNWITEAVSNIVKNALDHTSKNSEISIKWIVTPAVTKIIIKDNGKGIHTEDIHYIFKRFYRSRFSQDTQGIGLGLPLAKAIVEAHNGTITVDSKLGSGSIFTLDFLNLTKL